MRKNNKSIYLFLVFVIAIFGVIMGYAALGTSLKITGKANINKNTWDLRFDNIIVRKGSVEAISVPNIVDNIAVNFEFSLYNPGDFYEFTVDVVNKGSLDAMIDSISKEPDLSASQSKYLNYIIEYQNGEQIASNQIVKAQEFLRVKVRVEFRTDLTEADLPTAYESIRLGFILNYIQGDENGKNITDNGVKNAYTIVSGDLDTISSEICVGDQCFYVMASDENYVKLVSKYNLEVGYTCTSNSKASCTWMEEQSGIQKDTMIGKLATDKYPIYGTINFSNYNYWGNVEEYKYSYNSECLLYRYIEQYKEYLEFEGLRIEEARLISVDELFELGCTVNNCDAAPSWVIGTTYWTGGARSGGNDNVWVVENRIVYQFGSNHYTSIFTAGIRPVIVLAKNKL